MSFSAYSSRGTKGLCPMVMSRSFKVSSFYEVTSCRCASAENGSGLTNNRLSMYWRGELPGQDGVLCAQASHLNIQVLFLSRPDGLYSIDVSGTNVPSAPRNWKVSRGMTKG
jgi:hypothetical protein